MPRQGADICQPASVSQVLQLSDGSRVLLSGIGSLRAENREVPGWARYQADGQLDTAFCRRAARSAFHPQEVYEASGGKLWVRMGSNRFDPAGPPLLKRLNADGTADASFSTTITGELNTCLPLRDGRILVGGTYLSEGKQVLGRLACLRADGSVDTGFTTALGAFEGVVIALAQQRNGDILVGGRRLSVGGKVDLSLIRLRLSGQFDTGFQALLSPTMPLMALTVQADDKPVVLAGMGAATVVRFLPSGAPDPAFQLRLRQALYITNNRPPLVALADGRILFPAHAQRGLPPTNDPTWRSLLCVQSNGEQDTTFQYRALPPYISSLQQLPDGRVLAGTSLVRYAGVSAARLTPTGIVVLQPNGAPESDQRLPKLQGPGTVRALATYPHNQLLVAGSFSAVGDQEAHNLARLHSDGTLDTAFTRRCNLEGDLQHVVVQPDGRLLVAGWGSRVNNSSQLLLVRRLPDGSPDTTFAPPLLTADAYQSITALVLQPDGKVLLAGQFRLPGGKEHTLLRLTALGKVDLSFQPPVSTESARSLLVQPDGKILVGSYPSLVRRLLPDGRLDPTFQSLRYSGLVTTLAQYPDGRILVGGQFSAGGFQGIPQLTDLARLLPTGKTDTTFHAPSFQVRYIQALAVLPDGRLWVGGSDRRDSQGNNTAPFSRAVRLLSHGRLDPSFDPALGPDGDVNALLVLPDGALFLGGQFTRTSRPQFSLAWLPPAPAKKPAKR
ncbi:hypothetical protein [Hymenobacter sediminis]|uniref:hypothetical protein n=1 Tax=Hymenobacter sediminis TaxID=2218621 RepID=UPI001EE41456|nr:hypothetical protein [Hymenobacter sediminis]